MFRSSIFGTALAALLVAVSSCGTAFVSGHDSSAAGASGPGGAAGSGGGGAAGSGTSTASGAGGNSSGTGGTGGAGAAGGAGAGGTMCFSCAEAFEHSMAIAPILVCEDERPAYLELRKCICTTLGTTTCAACSDYCASYSNPSSDCLICADDDGACDSAGKDCDVSPF